MRTNIPTDELKRQLMSLYVNPKAKILTKLGDKDKKELDGTDQLGSQVTKHQPFCMKFWDKEMDALRIHSSDRFRILPQNSYEMKCIVRRVCIALCKLHETDRCQLHLHHM